MPKRPENPNGIVVLIPDEKESTINTLRHLLGAGSTLLDMLKDDKLTNEMQASLMFLLDNHFLELVEPLKYEDERKRMQDDRLEGIREANRKVRELEEMIGSNRPVDGLKQKLKFLHDTVDKWWDTYGFNHVSDPVFIPWGIYKAKFCFMIDMMRMPDDLTMDKKPASTREYRKSRIEEFQDEGYEFQMNNEDREVRLMATDNNMRLLTKLISDRFPSAKITSYRTHQDSKTGRHYYRELEVYIYELKDITQDQGVSSDAEAQNPQDS
jgi:hypothetical protein